MNNINYEEIYQNIRNILEEIKNSTCPSCGSKTFHNHFCLQCFNKSQELNNKLRWLNHYLNIMQEKGAKNYGERVVFSLLGLDDKKIDFVYAFIDNSKINLDFKISDIQNIYQKMQRRDKITKKEGRLVKLLIYSKHYDIDLFFNYFMYELLAKENENIPLIINFECFKNLICDFVQKEIKKFYQNGYCDIKEYAKGTVIINGESYLNYIYLSKTVLKDLYQKRNPKLLFTIFHELSHTKYCSKVYTGEYFSLKNLYATIEKILEQDRTYYKDNYIYDINEVYANIESLNACFKFFYANNIPFDLRLYYKNLEMYQERLQNKMRYYQGEEKTVLDIFDMYIFTKPELLENYPQLNFLYKLKNGLVVRKKKIELEEDLKSLEKTALKDKKLYLDFYQELLASYDVYEKTLKR